MPVIIFPYQHFLLSGSSSQQQQQVSNQIDNLSDRISTIEQALIDYGIPIDTPDSKVQEMLDDVFNGSDTEPVTPQNEDEQAVFSMLDDVFDGSDTESYEDEFTQDLDSIFYP